MAAAAQPDAVHPRRPTRSAGETPRGPRWLGQGVLIQPTAGGSNAAGSPSSTPTASANRPAAEPSPGRRMAGQIEARLRLIRITSQGANAVLRLPVRHPRHLGRDQVGQPDQVQPSLAVLGDAPPVADAPADDWAAPLTRTALLRYVQDLLLICATRSTSNTSSRPPVWSPAGARRPPPVKHRARRIDGEHVQLSGASAGHGRRSYAPPRRTLEGPPRGPADAATPEAVHDIGPAQTD